MNSKATFNERFAMKTILDFDVFNDEFEPKPVIITNQIFNFLFLVYFPS